MKRLSKRIRHSESAFSVERYTTCFSAAQGWCDSQCDTNGSNPYAMAIVREDRMDFYRSAFGG